MDKVLSVIYADTYDDNWGSTIEIFGVAGPLILYNSWMKKGFEFEKTGMITSQTFRGLIGKFKPSR